MYFTEFRVARKPPQVSFLSPTSVSVYNQGTHLQWTKFKDVLSFVTPRVVELLFPSL